ncbi:HlyD family secretion protein [Tenacibaculum sp. nBUS_03]|uniref:HlyD family secretion protein n=1 Tax=Tenacibaculum sp. nBUS_03 TaxID=3395320 RepID=UPI003EBD8FF8
MENFDQELNVYSEQVKDVLTSPPKAIFRWGNTILFFFFALVIFLVYIIRYPDVIEGQAVLTTTIPPQKEYAKVSGKLEQLFIKNNQAVKSGTHIALIENTANYNDIKYLRGIIDTLTLSSEKFQFPIEKLPMLFLGEIETAFSNFENNYILYVLNKESNAFLYENSNDNYTIMQLKKRLVAAKNQRNINEEELVFKKKNIERIKKLYKKGVISEQNYEYEKLEFLKAKRSFNDVNITISQIEERISNRSNDKKQSEVANVRKEINLLKSVLQSFDQLKRAIKEWEYKYLVKAKIDGTVSFMDIWSKNQTVKVNDFLLTIIPADYEEYVCKIQIPVINSRKLKIGQSVNIKLSSYPDYEFGVLKGNLNKISLIPNEKNMYLLDVSLPKGLLTTYNKQIEFNQEMHGVAEVITENLRLIERIFYKFKIIFNKS